MLGESLDLYTSLKWDSLQVDRLVQVGLPLSPRWARQPLATPLPTCKMSPPTHLLISTPSLRVQEVSQALRAVRTEQIPYFSQAKEEHAISIYEVGVGGMAK